MRKRLDEAETPKCMCVLQELFHSNEDDHLKKQINKKGGIEKQLLSWRKEIWAFPHFVLTTAMVSLARISPPDFLFPSNKSPITIFEQPISDL